jgi:hypothetical protein
VTIFHFEISQVLEVIEIRYVQTLHPSNLTLDYGPQNTPVFLFQFFLLHHLQHITQSVRILEIVHIFKTHFFDCHH